MKRAVRLSVDIALAASFVVMLTTALVQKAPHEWLGMATFLLFAVHMTFNRHRWMRSRRSGWTPARVALTVLDVALVGCILGQIVSCLVLSEYVFGWLPAIQGASWARTLHLLCSYWGFVLVFVHAGLHLRHMMGKSSHGKAVIWAMHVLCLALSLFGAISFVQLGLFDYMFLRRQFVFVDYSIPLWQSLVWYLCIGIMFASIAYYAQTLASRLGKKRRHKENFAVSKKTDGCITDEEI